MSRPPHPEDRFLRRRLLGEGGAGRVFLVEDRLRPGATVALKEAGTPTAEDASAADELQREFATLATLHHPCLVEVYEFDRSRGLSRFTLEFIEGNDIVDTVAREGPAVLPGLIAEALRALAFLHDAGLVHGDLKPQNVLVRRRPKLGCRLVLVDFGLARRGDETLEARRARGTLPYLAPELLQGGVPDRRSDLYALGAVLHEAVHDRPAFALHDDDLSRFVRAVLEGRRARPPLPDGHPAGLGAWLEELLSPDPAGRPAGAAEALARLNAALTTCYPVETAAGRAARLRSGSPGERRAELERIRRLLERRDGPRVVWLAGEPGSGKSRLLRWLGAAAMLEGWEVLAPARVSPAVLRELREIGARRRTLLLLDDVDTAGGDVADTLERIARGARTPGVRVVAALRPGSIGHPTIRELFAGAGPIPTLARIDLGRLDARGLREMAARATGGPVADERVRWLADHSGGVPTLAESFLIEGIWERGVENPSRRGVVADARAEVLDAEARSWLDALAVLDGGAEERMLADLAGLQPEAARAAAEEAAALGLARRRGARWFPDSRAVAEGLRAAIEPARRSALFRTAAERLEDADADPWQIARLREGAGEHERASAWAARAAERASREGEPAEAASRYAAALRLLPRRSERRFPLRRGQAEALFRAGLYAEAVRAWGGVARLARSETERTAAKVRLAHALVHSGRFHRALKVAERAAASAERAGEPAPLARARHAMGVVLARLGRESDALGLLTPARQTFRELADVRSEAETLQTIANCRLRLGDGGARQDFTEAIRLHRRAAAQEGAEPDRGPELKAQVGLAAILQQEGRQGEAIALLEQVRREASERGQRRLEEVALSRLAMAAIDDGRHDAAMQFAEQAADLAQRLGDENLALVHRCRLADARIRCGRAGEALASLREALQRPLTRVEPENIDYATMLLADAWMESGSFDDDHVRELLERAIERCHRRRKRRALLMALAIEMERRSRTDCPDPLDPVERRFDAEAGAREPDPEIRARAELARCRERLTRGDEVAAREAAARAVEAARRPGAEAFAARARGLLAESLDRLGRDADAAREREEGRRLLRRAAERIDAEDVREDFLRRAAFASLQPPGAEAPGTEHRRLAAMYDMIRVLNSETDPDALLESILDMALRAVGAERGMILLKDEDQSGDERGDGEEFSVRLARDLEEETVRDAESYSRRIVAEASAGRSVMTVDAGADRRFRDLKSISLYGIRSLMCVPLRSRGTIVGTVYLDNRRDGALFTPADLRFLEAFADHAALALQNVRARERLERQNRRLQAAAETRSSFGNLVGRSPGMQAVFDLIEKVASTDLPVLIGGESGTGKELVARAIHFHGARRRRPFVSENCAAIPETLLESELFGHVRGAFTGAERDRPGLFEQADGGTLFLDEIGDMPLAMQARLLRVLQEGEVRRIGGERPLQVDVRVVAATHRDPQVEVREGRFRQDLLYRIQVLTIFLPPLRERPGDVALLTEHLLRRIARERGQAPVPVDDDVLSLFERYRWPGNVRELENTLQRLALLAGRRAITVELIEQDPALRQALLRSRGAEPVFSLQLGERETIRRALEVARGDRRRAAHMLGVSRSTIYRKIKQHGL